MFGQFLVSPNFVRDRKPIRGNALVPGLGPERVERPIHRLTYDLRSPPDNATGVSSKG
jgi:hypothetical protein